MTIKKKADPATLWRDKYEELNAAVLNYLIADDDYTTAIARVVAFKEKYPYYPLTNSTVVADRENCRRRMKRWRAKMVKLVGLEGRVS